MRVTLHDIASSCEWAKEHCGDDNPADVMAHKLLGLFAESHVSSKRYHEREATDCEALMAEIEERFKVEPPIDDEF